MRGYLKNNNAALTTTRISSDQHNNYTECRSLVRLNDTTHKAIFVLHHMHISKIIIRASTSSNLLS